MIIGLTGYKQAGKDSTADVLVNEFGFKKIAFADALRNVALSLDPLLECDHPDTKEWYGWGSIARYTHFVKELGYEKAKQVPSVRLFLQKLGTEGIRKHIDTDAWVNVVDRTIAADPNADWVIADCRFPNEAEYVIGHRGLMWRIVREGQINTDLHESEAHIVSMPASTVIIAGSLAKLQECVRAAYKDVLAMEVA